MTDVLYILIGIGFLAAGVFGAILLVRWPPLVLAIAGAYSVISWDVPVVPPLATLMGSHVYFLDYFTLVLFVASFPRLWRKSTATVGALTGWLALLTLLCFSLLRGLGTNDAGLVMNEFRTFIYVAATLQWAFTLDWAPERVRQLIARGGQVIGWSLVAVFAIHVAIRGLGSADTMIIDPATGDLYSSRPLNAGQAMVLTLCAVVCLFIWLRVRRSAYLLSAVVFILCVLLAQNRSTWAAACGALIMLLIMARSGGRVRLIALGAAGVLVIAFVIATGALGDVFGKLTDSFESTGTYTSREDSWQILIHQQLGSGDLLRILFGSPMGDGYSRVESSGRLVVYAPHNWYVIIFLRLGVIGLTIFFVMIAVTLWRLLCRRNASAAAIVVALLLYGWAYSWNWYEMVFLGWAVSGVLVAPSLRHNGQRESADGWVMR